MEPLRRLPDRLCRRSHSTAVALVGLLAQLPAFAALSQHGSCISLVPGTAAGVQPPGCRQTEGWAFCASLIPVLLFRVQVKVQTVPGFAKGMLDGFPKYIQMEGVGG